MTNKEKLNKSINNDFNKEKNYKEIMKKIEKEENMGVKNNIWKWSIAPICLVAVLVSILFINFKNNNHKLSNYDTPKTQELDIKLNINTIKKASALRYDADIKAISTNGINIPWPDILKDGITIPDDLDKSDGYAIYTRKDKTGEYDILNCYVYNYFNGNDDNYKNIRLAFSKDNKPIRDYLFRDEGSIETMINNTKLKIYQYEDIYFSEFTYKGYNFDIETTNISEHELLSLLFSIIK